MSISCGECEYEAEPGETCWYLPEDYSTYRAKRGHRCNGCSKVIIKAGDLCSRIDRFKVANYDIEESIYGEYGEVPRAAHYLCETCTDKLFNIQGLGYCLSRYDDIESDFDSAVASEFMGRMARTYDKKNRQPYDGRHWHLYPVGTVAHPWLDQDTLKKAENGNWVSLRYGFEYSTPDERGETILKLTLPPYGETIKRMSGIS